MKKQNFLTLRLTLKLGVFVFVLFGGFFQFGYLPTAQAACTYEIKRFDPQGRTGALKTETLTFEISVTVSNVQCAKSNTSYAVLNLTDVKTSQTPSGVRQLKIAKLDYKTGTVATTTIAYNLGSLDTTVLNDPGTASFSLSVVSDRTTVATSRPWKVGLTGIQTSTTSSAVNVEFFAGSGTNKVKKSIYSANDTITFVFNISSQSLNFLVPQTSPNLLIKYNVNNKYSDSLGVARADLPNKPSSQFVVSPDFGFNNDSNSVVVSLVDKDNDKKLWETTATVQVSGLGGAGSGGPRVTIAPDKGTFGIGETIAFTAVGFAANSSVTISAGTKTVKLDASNAWKGTLSFDTEQTVALIISSTDSNFTTVSRTITISKTAAGGGPGGGGSNGSVTVNPSTGQVVYDCTQKDPDPRYCLVNPLPVDGLTDMVLLIMRGFTMIVAIWAVLFIIIGGFRMVVAAGNEEAIGVAKKTITWAVAGLVIAMLSFSMVAIVQNFIGARTPGINPTDPQATPKK